MLTHKKETFYSKTSEISIRIYADQEIKPVSNKLLMFNLKYLIL